MQARKYNNAKVCLFGITFDSKKEAERYLELKTLEKACIIEDLKLQVPFELLEKQKGERGVKYIVDFTYTEKGQKVAEDVKGFKTKDYIIKRKLFKSKYKEYEFRET